MSRWLVKNPEFVRKKKVFINARIIDPYTQKDFLGQLIVENGLISDFGKNIVTPLELINFEEVIDCNNNILMPGIIDIHVHLRDPGFTHKEDILSGTKSAASGGVTTVVCQPNTSPRIENEFVLQYIKNKARNSYSNVECYASVTKEDGDMSDILNLCQAGAVGFTDDGLPIENSFYMQKALEYVKDTGFAIAQHAEDMSLSNCGCINEGKISRKLNVLGIPEESESTIVARDLILLKKTKSKYHILHASSKQTVSLLVNAINDGLNVSCEVTPHHLSLTDTALDGYNTLAKMNPPLRNEESRIALIEALKKNYIQVIASDHAPHEPVSKKLPINKATFGIVGLETILPLSLELYHNGEIGLIPLLAKLTCNPAKIIQSDAGIIQKGRKADIIIVDLNKEWNIDINKFSSKSKNSPFHGRKVKGKIIKTFINGEIVFSDND